MAFDTRPSGRHIEIGFDGGVRYIGEFDLKAGMTLEKIVGIIQDKLDQGASTFYLRDINLLINCNRVNYLRLN